MEDKIRMRAKPKSQAKGCVKRWVIMMIMCYSFADTVTLMLDGRFL